MEHEPIDRPTVLLELDPATVAAFKQTVLRKVGGAVLTGMVMIVETDAAVAVLTADWLSPEVQAFMVKVAYRVVVDGKSA